MTLKDLQQVQNKSKRQEQADLEGIRSSGRIVNMTPEEKKAWFDEMRRAVEVVEEVKPFEDPK